MSFGNSILFFLAVAAATASPGPNILLLMVYSLKYGWKNALYSISGNVLSLFFQTAVAAFGFGAVITVFRTNLFYIQVLGAVYLFYLGLRILIQANKQDSIFNFERAGDIFESPPRFRMFKDAFLTSATNPKALLFQVAIFPQFLDHNLQVWPQFLSMFAIIVITVAVIHIFYAYFASKISKYLRNQRTRYAISIITGFWFLLFGALMILA